MTFKAIEANSEVHDTTSFGFLELDAQRRQATRGGSSRIRPAGSATAAAEPATESVRDGGTLLGRATRAGAAGAAAGDRRDREQADAADDEADDAVGDARMRRCRCPIRPSRTSRHRGPRPPHLRDHLECRRAIGAARLDERVLRELVPADHADRVGRRGCCRVELAPERCRRPRARRHSSRRSSAHRSQARQGRSRARRGRGQRAETTELAAVPR